MKEELQKTTDNMTFKNNFQILIIFAKIYIKLSSYVLLLSPGPISSVPYSAVFLDANICFQIIITYTRYHHSFYIVYPSFKCI